MQTSCVGCVYQQPSTGGGKVPDCRRYPPVAFMAGSVVYSRYPPAAHGCGEYLAAVDLEVGSVGDPIVKTTL